MMRIVRIGVLLATLLSVAGCGTVIARLDPDQYDSPVAYYQGTSAVLAMVGLGDRRWHLRGLPGGCMWMTPLCAPVVLVSLPADIAIDTLLLPVDYIGRDRAGTLLYNEVAKLSNVEKITISTPTALAAKTRYWLMYKRGNSKLTSFVSALAWEDGRAVIYVSTLKTFDLVYVSVKMPDGGYLGFDTARSSLSGRSLLQNGKETRFGPAGKYGVYVTTHLKKPLWVDCPEEQASKVCDE